jgi:Uncharacterised nucleotidyltransferase
MVCQKASNTRVLTAQPFYIPSNSISGFCPEIEIILCCARTQVEPEQMARVQVLVQGNIDWKNLILYANSHGVTQLLFQGMRQIDSIDLPEGILDYFQYFCHKNALRNIRLTRELISLTELFSVKDIAVVPFKGPVLSALAYRNLSLRQFGDLDLLVHEQDIEQACALLVAQGYQQGHLTKAQKRDLDFHAGEIVFINKASQTVVDLHWKITPKFFPFEIASKDWWHRLQPVPLSKTQAYTFCLEDTLLHLCVHAASHLWTRLEWLCDIAELIRTHGSEMDWRNVLEQAHRVGCDRILLLNCCLIRDLLGVSLPSIITQKIELDATLPSLTGVIKSFIVAPPHNAQPFDRMEGLLVFIRMRERPRHQLIHFIYVMNRSKWAIPSRKDRAVLPLPSAFTFLYWLIRPVRLLKKYRTAQRQFMAQ